MTREEAKDWWRSSTTYFDEFIDKVYEDFDEAIAKLETPKGCQLCKYWTDRSLQHCAYHNFDTTNIYHYCDGCVDYEPKD
jgi:hypothetical protein